jgi:hypothetical protein
VIERFERSTNEVLMTSYDEVHEERESLWFLVSAPVIWAVHFLLSYGTAAIWCAKVVGSGGSLAGARLAIAFYTAVALAGIAAIGWIGYRRHGCAGADLPHDDDTPEDRHRFLGFATLLLAALSSLAVGYETVVVVFIDRCW